MQCSAGKGRDLEAAWTGAAGGEAAASGVSRGRGSWDGWLGNTGGKCGGNALVGNGYAAEDMLVKMDSGPRRGLLVQSSRAGRSKFM